jgi:hypoxanthine phosphoribosyltransferase
LNDINLALDKLALALNQRYADTKPLVLCVMKGSLVTLGQLLPKLTFSLELDYIHASRYDDKLVGGEIIWHHKPSTPLSGRDVILVEDIVDRGDTLNVLRAYCMKNNAKSISCATLLNKIDVAQVCQPAEFIGLSIPDRYVFGFGMDYQGDARQLPGIYALAESAQ